jgi:hypothetical protein
MQIMNQWRSAKDYDLTTAQELKIINLILESIKVSFKEWYLFESIFLLTVNSYLIDSRSRCQLYFAISYRFRHLHIFQTVTRASG